MKKNEIIEVQGVKLYPYMIECLVELQECAARSELAAFDEMRTFIEAVSEDCGPRVDFMHYTRLVREMERLVRVMAGLPLQYNIKYIADNTDSD